MVLIAPPSPKKTPQALRLTVEDVLRLIHAGAFHPEQRFELLDGEIIYMPPIEAPHGESTDTLYEHLFRKIGDTHRIRCQGAIRLNAYSAPEPDFAILQRREGGYGKALPTAEDTYLVIEVSATTQRYDLGKKRDAYARASIPEYWVLDLKKQELHVFRKPWDGTYTEHDTLDKQASVTCSTIPGLKLHVADMM